MRLYSHPHFALIFVDFKLKQSSYGTYTKLFGPIVRESPKRLGIVWIIGFSLIHKWDQMGVSKMGTLNFDQIFHLRCYTPFPDTPKWLR